MLHEAVVIDFSKYLNRILEIDPRRRRARVQPGVVLDDLRKAAREHGLTFAPDPATHNHNTLGGMVGNNSCGPHSVMGGNTVDNVLGLEVLTYRGARFRVSKGECDRNLKPTLERLAERHADEIRSRYPHIPRRVSGYQVQLPRRRRQFSGEAGRSCTATATTSRERVLAPAVRGAGERDLVLSDGFSCREQISHLTGRRALHLAEVLSNAGI